VCQASKEVAHRYLLRLLPNNLVSPLFAWLIAKTCIQRAGKATSATGLLAHVFDKITSAFIYVISPLIRTIY
jgi:hypothetical protein